MSHTGIRLKISVPGAVPGGIILEADSDWLHLNAIMAGAQHYPTMAELMSNETVPSYDWVQVGTVIGTMEIWIQPVSLPDDYPDDQAEEDDQAEAEPQSCGCCCSNCSGCLGSSGPGWGRTGQ